jgi:simple sugar transport system permease protein
VPQKYSPEQLHLSGFLVGFAAIIIASRVNSAKVGYGDTYLLQAILVAVLGGISPMGRRGKLINVMIGVLILQMLQSAFTIFAFSPYAKRLIFGFMLLLVMVVNYYLDKIHTRSIFVQEDLDTQAEVKNELRTSI